jgi:hypothetical protein
MVWFVCTKFCQANYFLALIVSAWHVYNVNAVSMLRHKMVVNVAIEWRYLCYGLQSLNYVK